MEKYRFHTSGKEKNIESEKVFNGLQSDELTELLYEDARYIRWMDSRHTGKLTPEDTIFILEKSPELLNYLDAALKKLNQYHWESLLGSIPESRDKLKYMNYSIFKKVEELKEAV